MKKITIAELDKAREEKKEWVCPKCLGRNGCMCALKKDWFEAQEQAEDKKEKGKIMEIIKSGKFPGFDHKMGGKR